MVESTLKYDHITAKASTAPESVGAAPPDDKRTTIDLESLPHYNSAPVGPFAAPSSNLGEASGGEGRMIGVVMGPLPNWLT
ncbi:hypothetical protein BHM03_00048111 [Ensete ventricosum]|nr:hypothetical protein BHM03_00048111 [Ensete ventricosum]